jgi:hypothetical protein
MSNYLLTDFCLELLLPLKTPTLKFIPISIHILNQNLKRIYYFY